MKGEWFICKSCGKPAVVFSDGFPPHLPPGTVGHSKPVSMLGRPLEPSLIPNGTGCILYVMTEPEVFADMHKDVPRIDPPEEFRRCVVNVKKPALG